MKSMLILEAGSVAGFYSPLIRANLLESCEAPREKKHIAARAAVNLILGGREWV